MLDPPPSRYGRCGGYGRCGRGHPTFASACRGVAGYWAGPGTDCTDADENGTADACENECPADLDGDGDVDTADLLALLGAWGTPDGDVDGDGDTDTADLLALLGAWGECP